MISNVFDIIFLKFLNFILRSRPLYVLCGIGVLKIFEKVTGETAVKSFFNKVEISGPATVSKRNFVVGVFM